MHRLHHHNAYVFQTNHFPFDALIPFSALTLLLSDRKGMIQPAIIQPQIPKVHLLETHADLEQFWKTKPIQPKPEVLTVVTVANDSFSQSSINIY